MRTLSGVWTSCVGPLENTKGGPTQLVQTPDKVLILYGYNHQVRHVRMNAKHPDHVTPSWYGDSVGRYEGDTLIVDTVGMKIGPYSMVDWYGTPHSEALHVVERYRMLDYDGAKDGFEQDAKEHNVPEGKPVANTQGRYLQLRFTVEDKNVFTMPWSATITYARPLGEWEEHVCAENTLEFYSRGTQAAVPTANKPDF